MPRHGPLMGYIDPTLLVKTLLHTIETHSHLLLPCSYTNWNIVSRCNWFSNNSRTWTFPYHSYTSALVFSNILPSKYLPLFRFAEWSSLWINLWFCVACKSSQQSGSCPTFPTLTLDEGIRVHGSKWCGVGQTVLTTINPYAYKGNKISSSQLGDNHVTENCIIIRLDET